MNIKVVFPKDSQPDIAKATIAERLCQAASLCINLPDYIEVHFANLGPGTYGEAILKPGINRVMKTVGIWPFKKQVIDPAYFCVCVEQTDFRPILFEDAIKRIKAQGGQVGFRQGNGPAVD